MIPSGIIYFIALSLVTSINCKIHSDICIYRTAKIQTDYFGCTAFIHTGCYDGRVFFIYVTNLSIRTASTITYLNAVFIMYATVIAYQQQICRLYCPAAGYNAT